MRLCTIIIGIISYQDLRLSCRILTFVGRISMRRCAQRESWNPLSSCNTKSMGTTYLLAGYESTALLLVLCSHDRSSSTCYLYPVEIFFPGACAQRARRYVQRHSV